LERGSESFDLLSLLPLSRFKPSDGCFEVFALPRNGLTTKEA